MSLLDFLLHLLSFMAPAVFLAAALVLWAIVQGRGRVQLLLPWWQCAVLNATLGALVLALGVVLGGQDGRMATYTVLVVVMGSCQWLLGLRAP